MTRENDRAAHWDIYGVESIGVLPIPRCPRWSGEQGPACLAGPLDRRTGAVFSGASFGPALREGGPSRPHD